MASASFQWHTTDTYNFKRKEAAPVYQPESNNPLVTQMVALTKQLECLMRAQDQPTKSAHNTELDQEEANFMGNNYNSGWRNSNTNPWGSCQGNQNAPYRPPHVQNQGEKLERREAPRFQSNFQEQMMQYVHSSDKRIVKLEAQMEQQIEREDKRKLHINILFVEAISQMSKYAKFLKEMLSNKKKLEEFEIVKLNEECSEILLRKLPPKLKDPGSFTILCTIGNSYFDKALCDLGASINLMPFSVFRRLGMQEPKPTSISLQLADRSITYPRGIVEDVLVKVDKFIFPADFIVLDMEEDDEVPIILGRPFLATGRTIIDVQQGKLTLRLNEEEVVFKVFNSLKHPSTFDSCNFVSTADVTSLSLNVPQVQDGLMKDVLERILTLERRDLHDTEEIIDEILALNSGVPGRWFGRRIFEDLGEHSRKRAKPLVEEPPEIELKPLPSNLKYAFLHPPSHLPVIISANLIGSMEDKLLRVLRENKEAFG
ncbi:uncharacterized protein LOC113850771 [Abrus precatorius]|uniref:Uncharacterized protein LOC113850771 n=1 Tax=Abrus precatorius TaxID=3816 RepID=A0A8B8K069_ABRPR|nr:uncharacterized protein LOC113850771 [Abrus precatorius]